MNVPDRHFPGGGQSLHFAHVGPDLSAEPFCWWNAVLTLCALKIEYHGFPSFPRSLWLPSPLVLFKRAFSLTVYLVFLFSRNKYFAWKRREQYGSILQSLCWWSPQMGDPCAFLSLQHIFFYGESTSSSCSHFLHFVNTWVYSLKSLLKNSSNPTAGRELAWSQSRFALQHHI